MSTSTPGFRYIDHMTDAVIEAYGDTLDQAFENAARGLNDTMIDLSTVVPNQKIKLNADGQDLENLLFDWLDKVMLVLVSDNIVMSDFKVAVRKADDGTFSLSANCRGEKINLDKHRYKVEIKAVTYHEMKIDCTKGKVVVRFLLDL